MGEVRITTVVLIIVGIVYLIKGAQYSHHLWKHCVPEQLAELVRQAHSNRPFQTMWDIKVSDEMREALQAPLTPQQIHAMAEAKDDDISRFVNCSVLSHKVNTKGLSGIVKVTIDIRSRSGLHNYHFQNVRLRIVVDGQADLFESSMTVRSVEQL